MGIYYLYIIYNYIPYVRTIMDHYDMYATYHQQNKNYNYNLSQITSQNKMPIFYNIPSYIAIKHIPPALYLL